MNTLDGSIHESNSAALEAGAPFTHIMPIVPTIRQIHRGKVNVYDPCPCGSGKKFKFCHKGKPFEPAPADGAQGSAEGEGK